MRKAPIISEKEFIEIYDELKKKYDRFPLEVPDRMEKDLSKVEFDWENYELSEPTVLENGLVVLWGWAGGDWEYPVSFIIYHDGKEMRGYIPEIGNVFNRKTMSAFGNESDPIEFTGKECKEAMEWDIINHFEIISNE